MASPPRALRPDHSSSSGAANRSSATYYTNEEIEILFHVVQKGESLLSELPEQDQLPTNALFLAAETVFPRHHIDPDDVPAHLSRLMFKIGGDREGTSLMDKFRSVLGGMGIELDFGGSSTSDYSPAQPSRLSSSVADNDDCRESPRVSHGQGPTRRHSSSSLSPPRAALPDRSRGRGCNGVPHHPVSLGDLQPGIQFAYGDYSDEDDYGRSEQAGGDPHHYEPDRHNAGHYNLVEVEGADDTLRNEAVYDDTVRHGEDHSGTVESGVSGEAPCDAAQEVELEDAVQEDEEYSRYREDLERRARCAGRAYDLVMMEQFVDRWQERTQEEVERTGVARRHVGRFTVMRKWSDQVEEDLGKLKMFVLKQALDKMDEAMRVSSTLHERAVDCYENDLMCEGCAEWRDATRENVADELCSTRVCEYYTESWQEAAHAQAGQEAFAVEADEQAQLDWALNNWHMASEDLAAEEERTAKDYANQDAQHWVDSWHTEARLNSNLKRFDLVERDRNQTKALKKWSGRVLEAWDMDLKADCVFLEPPTTTWNLESKLIKFHTEHQQRMTGDLLEKWRLDARLARWTTEDQEKKTLDVLHAWRQKATDQNEYRVKEHTDAEMVDNFLTAKFACVDWCAIYDERRPRQEALEESCLASFFSHESSKSLGRWRSATAHSIAENEEGILVASSYECQCLAKRTVSHWHPQAKRSYQERLTARYREHRAADKRRIARESMDTWLNAAKECAQGQEEAASFYERCFLAEARSLVAQWRDVSERARLFHQVSCAPEMEWATRRWEGIAETAREYRADARLYDEEKTGEDAVTKWQFELMVARRRQEAAPAASSIMSRRSMRQRTQVREAELGLGLGLGLGPMDEFDESVVPDLSTTPLVPPKMW